MHKWGKHEQIVNSQALRTMASGNLAHKFELKLVIIEGKMLIKEAISIYKRTLLETVQVHLHQAHEGYKVGNIKSKKIPNYFLEGHVDLLFIFKEKSN